MIKTLGYSMRCGLRLNISNNIKNISKLHTISFGGVDEIIVEKQDYPLDKCKEIIGNRKIGVIGYGPQGRSQSLNLRDNGFDVCVGVREGESYKKAIEDGWVENKNLMSISQTAKESSIIQYLLSDTGQVNQWPDIYQHLTKGKTLYFSHGFGVVFNKYTNIIPPIHVDTVLVAPKGAGISVREKFTKGEGINVSYAIHQDVSKTAKDTCLALAFGIGCGHAFETTFENEVYSDLTGERSVLMGMIQGAFSAQYKVLRDRGHTPSEAYNETVEEALVSLYPLISDKGMDWLYANCSTTAQRGALDWAPRFEEAIRPVIEECYESVLDGTETKNVLKANKNSNYRMKLNNELRKMSEQELWKVARVLRDLRN